MPPLSRPASDKLAGDGTIKRTRKTAPKSRRGCSRCKRRRIKCDEKEPGCSNCMKFGYQCPGFQQNLRWSKKHERLAHAVPTNTPCDIPEDSHFLMPEYQTIEAGYNNETNTENVSSSSAACNVSCSELDLIMMNDSLTSLLTFPDTPQIMAAQPAELLAGNDRHGLSGSHHVPHMSTPQHHTAIPSSAPLMHTPTHLPTILIEHWFRSVCPMWSVFDSEVSYIRQLAWSTWSTSKALFFTIQGMSAAGLSVNTPDFRGTLSMLRSEAVVAIDEVMSSMQETNPPKIESGLVYAVFLLGNSLESTCNPSNDSRSSWLEYARTSLSIWKRSDLALDRSLYAFFCQALNYWEMLLAARGQGSIPEKIERRRQHYRLRIQQAVCLPDRNNEHVPPESPFPDSGDLLLGTRPNSWSGISHEVIDIFGQTLALCHRACEYAMNTSGFNAAMATDALCDVSLAHELQQEIIAMDIESILSMEKQQGFPIQTNDDRTPITDLLQTANAYRLAALLQLHMSFRDLEMTPPEMIYSLTHKFPWGHQIQIPENNTSREQYLRSLTLQLISMLEQVPAQSGSQSIQLMLYLSAAAGLEFESPLQAGSFLSGDYQPEAELLPLGLEHGFSRSEMTISPSLPGRMDFLSDNYGHISKLTDIVGNIDSRTMLEVSRGRDLVLKRLRNLQETLPHRRVNDTIRFVKLIWEEYDNRRARCSSIAHWLKFMSEKGLHISLW